MDELLTLDRLGPPWAVLETPDGITFNFPLNLLPEGVKEGDVLKFDIDIDREATEERIKDIQGLIDDLKNNDKGGDIQL
ncbi:MAG: DUF3006 domain-containing protein [Candidatus Atribacteria bacterium]|nr:DUF3006 domain-containing protein [Candidatus Atribacteria bacterium]